MTAYLRRLPGKIADVLLGFGLWSFIAKIYWVLYEALLPGWRKDYASFMRRKASNRNAYNKNKERFDEVIEKHPELMPNPFVRRMREFDYMLCKLFLGAHSFANYFYFEYYKYGPVLRNRFMTSKRSQFINGYLNTAEAEAICKDKPSSARYWQKWYHRNWLAKEENSMISQEQFNSAFANCERIIVKPAGGFGGHGIFVLPAASAEEKQAALERINSEEKGCIVEEYIRQTGYLHDLNPSSLNTVRAVCVKHTDGRVEPLFSILRVGKAGANVDNISSGGISFDIDIKTGKILLGSDFDGNHFTSLPDSGIEVTGSCIPRWDEFLRFCTEAHEAAPKGLNFAAWDVCISEDNMYLLEVNGQPGVACRRPKEINAWDIFRKILDEYYPEKVKDGTAGQKLRV